MGTLLKELRYSLYVTVHPFKGYWEIKHERKGSLRTAGILLTLYILVSVFSGYCTSYLFAKSVLMIVFILLGMCMMAYIALLFFNLIQQMSGFFVTLWAELKLRLS